MVYGEKLGVARREEQAELDATAKIDPKGLLKEGVNISKADAEVNKLVKKFFRPKAVKALKPFFEDTELGWTGSKHLVTEACKAYCNIRRNELRKEQCERPDAEDAIRKESHKILVAIQNCTGPGPALEWLKKNYPDEFPVKDEQEIVSWIAEHAPTADWNNAVYRCGYDKSGNRFYI
jgi:hypothetical protein